MITKLKPAEVIVRTKMFFILGLLYVIFTVGSFWHLHSNFIRDREALKTHISTGIHLHLNELLGEIALSDAKAVKSHLDVMRKGFDLDKITLEMNSSNFLEIPVESESKHVDFDFSSRMVNALFPASFIEIPIVGGKGTIATIHAFYQGYLESSVTKPILTTFAIQFLLMLVTISFVGFFIARFMKTVFSNPAKKVVQLIERISTGNFDVQHELQVNYGSKEIEIIIDGLGSMARNIKSLQNDVRDQSALAAIGNITNQVIHDLSGPLHSINVARDYLIKMKTDDPYFADHMKLLQLGANRLNRVASDLLDQNKNVASQKESFLLQDVVQQLEHEYQLQCKDLLLKTALPTKPITLHGSQIALQRAFANIIKNAVEAMKGKGEIEIAVEQRDADVHISISDNGPGMNESTLQKILHGGHSEGKSNGRGIGMKVVRETVEDFGGTLSATSVLGVGTKFSITLPLAAS